MNGLPEVLGNPPAPILRSTASMVNGPTVSVWAAAPVPNTPARQERNTNCRMALVIA